MDREGLAALSLRRLARDTNVSHAAPARHFEGLAGVHAAVASRGLKELLEWMRRIPSGADPLTRMRRVGVGYILFAFEHEGVFRAMFHPDLVPHHGLEGVREAYDATFGYVVESVAACQDADMIRPGSAHELAQYAWSSVHGAAVLAIDEQLSFHEDHESYANRATGNLFAGLRNF